MLYCVMWYYRGLGEEVGKNTNANKAIMFLELIIIEKTVID